MPSERYKTADHTQDDKTYTNVRGTSPLRSSLTIFCPRLSIQNEAGVRRTGTTRMTTEKKQWRQRGHLGLRLVPFRIFEIKMAGTRARGAPALT